MLNTEERDKIITAVAALVATHQTAKVTQPRSPAHLQECERRETAQENATRRLLALLDTMTEDAA